MLASDGSGRYRLKLTLTAAQAHTLGLRKRTLIATGSRTLHAGANTVSLKLGKGLRARLHRARIKPTVTITPNDGGTLRQRTSL